MTSISTDFPIPPAAYIAAEALKFINRMYPNSYVAFSGRTGEMQLALNEEEALELATPENDDSFYTVEELIEEYENQLSAVLQ